MYLAALSNQVEDKRENNSLGCRKYILKLISPFIYKLYVDYELHIGISCFLNALVH